MDKQQLIAVLGQFGEADAIAEVIHAVLPLREPLPDQRRTERKKITLGELSLYIEVGFYSDNRPGEVFIKCGKAGTMARDLFDALAVTLSISLQHGVALSAYPLKGRGNEMTGEGNALMDEIFTTLEELCVPLPSTSSTEPTPST